MVVLNYSVQKHTEQCNEVEVVFGLRVAELADGIVWLGLVVSRSEMAGIHLQPITLC